MSKVLTLNEYKITIFKTWPWLTMDLKSSAEDVQKFKLLTYKNKKNIKLGDEFQHLRILLIYKICLRFCFNGRNNKPCMSSVWLNLHSDLIIPSLLKDPKCEEDGFLDQYTEYFYSKYNIEERIFQEIWNLVFIDKISYTQEEIWVLGSFEKWVIEDSKKYNLYTESLFSIQESSQLESDEENINEIDNKSQGESEHDDSEHDQNEHDESEQDESQEENSQTEDNIQESEQDEKSEQSCDEDQESEQDEDSNKKVINIQQDKKAQDESKEEESEEAEQSEEEADQSEEEAEDVQSNEDEESNEEEQSEEEAKHDESEEKVKDEDDEQTSDDEEKSSINIISPIKVSTPFVNKVSTPPVTKVSTPSVTKVSTPSVTKVSTQPVTKVSIPSVTKVSTQPVSKVSSPSVTKVSTVPVTKVSTPEKVISTKINQVSKDECTISNGFSEEIIKELTPICKQLFLKWEFINDTINADCNNIKFKIYTGETVICKTGKLKTIIKMKNDDLIFQFNKDESKNDNKMTEVKSKMIPLLKQLKTILLKSKN